MLLNAELNDTSQKILWEDNVHTHKHIRNSMGTTDSTTSLFEKIYGEKPNIIGLFWLFGRIDYATKWDKFKKQMTEKAFKAIMVGYTDNNMRDT